MGKKTVLTKVSFKLRHEENKLPRQSCRCVKRHSLWEGSEGTGKGLHREILNTNVAPYPKSNKNKKKTFEVFEAVVWNSYVCFLFIDIRDREEGREGQRKKALICYFTYLDIH